MRTDPTDNGGLFVGRRPGTAPIRYRGVPVPGSASRRRLDTTVAAALFVAMIVVNLLFWGPLPAAGMWLGSQASYHTNDNLFLGMVVAFAACLGGLMLGLVLLKRLESAWLLVRRAAGHDQREGIVGRMFGICAIVGGAGFFFWLLFIGGLGSSFGNFQ